MKRIALCSAVTVCLTACGGSATAEQQAAKAGQQAATALESAVKDAVAGKAAGPVVSHESLKPFLPELSGWTRGEIQAETTSAMGISISRVQADYEKGDAGLSFEIMDCSLNQAVVAPFMALARSGYMEKTDEGYTKAVTVGGLPGYELWTTEPKNGEVGVLAGGRFLVKVTGNTVPDIDTVRRALETIDLQKLGALK